MLKTRETTSPPTTPPVAQSGRNGGGGGGGGSRFGRLLSTRRGSIFLAVLAALGALAVLVVFMTQYKDSVSGGGGEVEVLVADTNLDVGTSGDVIAEFGLFTTETVSESEAIEGVFTDPSSLAGNVVTEPVTAGQQLTASALSGTSDPVVGKIDGVQRAISVPVGNAQGSVGTIEAGSHVDVFAAPDDNSSIEDAASALSVLARDLTVLRVPAGEEASSGVTGETDAIVVLRATDVEAGRIALAESSKNIWLIVRPPTRAKDSQIDAEALESIGANGSLGG